VNPPEGMPNPDFFSRLGLFVDENFLDAGSCARIRSEARAGAGVIATVHSGGQFVVDEGMRKVKAVPVPEATARLVESRLLALKPQLERHFGLALGGCEEAQFLLYEEGDCYKAHRDGYAAAGAAEYFTRRRVSVVLFLNDEAEEPGGESYAGGALTFYGLMGGGRWQDIGFPLRGAAGLLVAFRSDVYHSVEAVTGGRRYTVVYMLQQGEAGAP
jgi:SM-20-related protein